MSTAQPDTYIRDLQEQIHAASDRHEAHFICGGGSKHFRLPAWHGPVLSTRPLQGIVDYEPTELVVTARAGMCLQELQQELAAAGQMLGFEPPVYGGEATVGGTVACALSGPRRPYAGAARDFVLGVRCLNGSGEDLRFGGRVMKNVAGYDLARLMTGAWGTLGVLLEVSLKVLPLPEAEQTYGRELAAGEAIELMNRLAARPLPLSAAAWLDGVLYVRFSGAASAVEAAGRETGFEPVADGDSFWTGLREQQLDFFRSNMPLWRLSLPATAAMPDIGGDWIVDWGGAQRWLLSEAPAATVHRVATAAGGHATLYRYTEQQQQLPALPPALLNLQQQLKRAFDPACIFNPGLLYTEAAC